MERYRMAYAMAAVAIVAMIITCKGPNSPDNSLDTPPGTVILSEGFEGDLLNYRQIMYDDTHGMMSISTQHALSGKGSLTSDSNNTGIKGILDPYIDDSIAGLQFYVMAAQAAHTNFFAALCKPGSSADGMVTKFGMGIDKSDSLKYVYEDYLNGAANEHINFAPLDLNKWYKCKIEYNYSDTTLTYFLDDAVICTKSVPNPISLQIFIVVRDNLGAQGPSGYYLDEVAVYKR